MKPRPDEERRRRRRSHPVRFAVVTLWSVVAVATLIGFEGAFWRDVDYWMEQARDHAAAERWSAALDAVGHALDAAPRDPGLLTFAGYAHGALTQWPQAEERFEQALAEDPAHTEAALGLAEARLAMGDSVGAVAALDDDALRSADAAQIGRAAALSDAGGRPDVALELLEARRDPATLEDRIRLARAAERHDREVDLLAEALREGPTPEQRRAHALALHRAGRDTLALEAYEALATEGLLDADAAVQHAWLLADAGRQREALSALEAAPPTPEVHRLAARAALWNDDPSRARVHLGALEALGEEDPALMDEIRALEARHARLAMAAEEARRRATPPTDPDEALTFWRERLAADPSDEVARAEVVALLEAAGRFEEARRSLLGSRTVADVGSSQELLHLAQLSLWADHPEDALRALDRWMELPAAAIAEPDGAARGAFLLQAEALLETRDPAAAYDALTEAGPAPADASADELLLRARVADATGRASEAADHLGRLARVRALEVEERAWWAGLLWRSGGLEGALAGYEGLLEVRPDDPTYLRAVGDLRMALDDPAGAEAAYRRVVELEGPADPAAPGLALALLRQGRTAAAIARYEAYLDRVPGDTDARLALARALAATRTFDDAGEAYERHAADLGAAVDPALAGEIADTWMAAGRPERAEPWAARAAASGEPLALARHANLLRMLERHRDADQAVDALADVTAEGLEGALADAWVARLRNRPVRALAALDGEVPGDGPTETVVRARVFQAEVAEARGDLATARAMVRAAREAGATDDQVRHVEERLDARNRPFLSAGFEGGSDENALDVGTGWARFGMRLAQDGPPAVFELRHREGRQGSVARRATAFAAGIDSLFLGRTVRLGARLGVEGGGVGETRLLGGLELTLDTETGRRWTLEGTRDPVWGEGARSGAPEYARVRNLGALDPDLMVTEVRATVATSPPSPLHRSFRLETGASSYSDENERAFGYGEARLPLRAGAEGAFALVPNAYAEGFSEDRATYASPDWFFALGLAGDARRDLGRTELGLRVNPHYYRYPGRDGLGLEGRISARIAAGPGSVLLGGRYLRQGGLYDLFRLSTEVSFPLGHGP